MPKATKAEIEHRVDEVYELLLQRSTHQAILDYGARRWGVKERQMSVYIARARERLRSNTQKSQEERLGTAIASYERLIQLQFERRDYSGARQTMDSLNRLQGLISRDGKPSEAAPAQKGYVNIIDEDI